MSNCIFVCWLIPCLEVKNEEQLLYLDMILQAFLWFCCKNQRMSSPKTSVNSRLLGLGASEAWPTVDRLRHFKKDVRSTFSQSGANECRASGLKPKILLNQNGHFQQKNGGCKSKRLDTQMLSILKPGSRSHSCSCWFWWVLQTRGFTEGGEFWAVDWFCFVFSVVSFQLFLVYIFLISNAFSLRSLDPLRGGYNSAKKHRGSNSTFSTPVMTHV